MQGLTTANVQAGSAIIENDADSVTIAQNLQHDPSLGACARRRFDLERGRHVDPQRDQYLYRPHASARRNAGADLAERDRRRKQFVCRVRWHVLCPAPAASRRGCNRAEPASAHRVAWPIGLVDCLSHAAAKVRSNTMKSHFYRLRCARGGYDSELGKAPSPLCLRCGCGRKSGMPSIDLCFGARDVD